MKMLKLRNHLEWSRRDIDCVSNLLDQSGRRVADESCAFAKMNDSIGFQSHQPCAGRVGGHRIIGEHDLPQETSGAVEGPVAFHCHNAVGDHKVDRNSALLDLTTFTINNLTRQSGRFIVTTL